jgi:hypothetical protein
MTRLLLFVFVFGIFIGIIYLVRKLMQPSDSIRCTRCDGRGFWLAARGREKCDWCKGTGRLYKQS